MNRIKMVQVQAIFAKNEPLHAYLKSKGLNRQANLFFIEADDNDYSNIIMLSVRGHLFKFSIENGAYRSIRFEDPQLLAEALRTTKRAVWKYPYYAETLKLINRNLSYAQPSQGLF